MPVTRKRNNARGSTAGSRQKKPRYSEGPEPESSHTEENDEVVGEEDICSICALLLVRPITTNCNHTFCEDCFKTWADISLIDRIELGLDIDDDSVPRPVRIEAKCPMCRSLTLGMASDARADALLRAYPQNYIARLRELDATIEDDDGALIEPIEILIGNEHQLVRFDDDEAANKHSWRFFVKVSRTEIMEEIIVLLHPTFRDHKITLTHAPYSIRRLGWGVFDVDAFVVLKAGYSWKSSDAQDTPDGAPNGRLPLGWRLDFNGRGSQGRLRLRVKKQKDGQEEEDQRLTERNRRAWMRQRERDPDCVPPDED